MAVLAASLALFCSPVLAADHPDIAGTWIVDVAKSDFGPMPAPPDLQFEIKAQADDFTVKQTGGGQPEVELRFNTAGKEMTNQIPGAQMTSTHHWEGSVLVGEIKIAADDGNKITFKDRNSYSADGKVMTMSREITSLLGDAKMTIVMNRK
jgi:hypothetical protein